MKCHRGDVVLVDFPLSNQLGSKLRPAVVVQSDHNNRRLANTIIAQITSNLQHAQEATRIIVDPSSVEGKSSGLHGRSVVACENLVTIHSDLLLRVIGRMSDSTMHAIDTALKAALGIS